jgi:GNAT superfamily N-acetyltransferase
MPVRIRPGKKEDLPAVLAMVHELAAFERAPDAITNTLAEMEADGFGPSPAFRFLVAETDGRVVGLALYFTKYSTWKGRGLYLDDLVVTEAYRGRGIGKQLMLAFLEEARAAGARLVHWQVLDWNTPAIGFYQKMGAAADPEWLDCKMDADQIASYLRDAGPGE